MKSAREELAKIGDQVKGALGVKEA
jgi:hypothetical protein